MIRCLASAIFLCAAVQTQAAILTFDNRADFLAAVGATTQIDFGGIAAEGTTASFNTAAGLTLAGVQLVGQTGGAATPNVLTVVDPGFFPAYNRGGLVASLVGPLNPNHGPDPRILINAPVGTPFFAAGFDLYSVQQGVYSRTTDWHGCDPHRWGFFFRSHGGPQCWEWTRILWFPLHVPDHVVRSRNLVGPERQHVGRQLRIFHYWPDVAVPEPSSGIAVLSGIAGLLLLRRRLR